MAEEAQLEQQYAEQQRYAEQQKQEKQRQQSSRNTSGGKRGPLRADSPQGTAEESVGDTPDPDKYLDAFLRGSRPPKVYAKPRLKSAPGDLIPEHIEYFRARGTMYCMDRIVQLERGRGVLQMHEWAYSPPHCHPPTDAYPRDQCRGPAGQWRLHRERRLQPGLATEGGLGRRFPLYEEGRGAGRRRKGRTFDA